MEEPTFTCTQIATDSIQIKKDENVWLDVRTWHANDRITIVLSWEDVQKMRDTLNAMLEGPR